MQSIILCHCKGFLAEKSKPGIGPDNAPHGHRGYSCSLDMLDALDAMGLCAPTSKCLAVELGLNCLLILELLLICYQHGHEIIRAQWFLTVLMCGSYFCLPLMSLSPSFQRWSSLHVFLDMSSLFRCQPLHMFFSWYFSTAPTILQWHYLSFLTCFFSGLPQNQCNPIYCTKSTYTVALSTRLLFFQPVNTLDWKKIKLIKLNHQSSN